MKGKYFLRGMGLGIFVTALILAIAFAFYEPEISTADIEKQARALGMEYTDLTAKAVDEKDLQEEAGDASEDTEEQTGEDKESDGTKQTFDQDNKQEDTEKTSENPSTEYKSTDTQTDSKTAETKPAADTSSSDAPKTGAEKLISFTISSGQSSEVVSANLYKAGIISDPNEFNHYLEQNGYDAKIHTGSFNISSDSSFEQIANAIAY